MKKCFYYLKYILKIGDINFNKIRFAWFEISNFFLHRVWSLVVMFHGGRFSYFFFNKKIICSN